MKKLFLTLFCLALTAVLSAANLAETEPRTNYIRVKTDFYQVTFFPKHQFPVHFRTASGEDYPQVLHFLDRIVIPGRKPDAAFYLWRDQWVKQEIITNTADKCVIRCTGCYCNPDSDKTAPGNIRAVYTYEMSKTSPDIKVVADISRGETYPATVVFLQPAWNGIETEFDRAVCKGKTYDLSRWKDNTVITKCSSVALIKGKKYLGISFNNHDKIVQLRFKCKDGYTSILDFHRTGCKSGKMHLTGFITVKEIK